MGLRQGLYYDTARCRATTRRAKSAGAGLGTRGAQAGARGARPVRTGWTRLGAWCT